MIRMSPVYVGGGQPHQQAERVRQRARVPGHALLGHEVQHGLRQIRPALVQRGPQHRVVQLRAAAAGGHLSPQIVQRRLPRWANYSSCQSNMHAPSQQQASLLTSLMLCQGPWGSIVLRMHNACIGVK